VTIYRHGAPEKWINALTGATVPRELDAILRWLPTTYDKYPPAS